MVRLHPQSAGEPGDPQLRRTTAGSRRYRADDAQMSMVPLLEAGPFTRITAARAGLRRRELDRLVRAGRLVRVHREVFLAQWLIDDVVQRAAAIGLVLPPGAAVCRGTAAWLHGVDARPPGQHLALPRLEVLVPAPAAPPLRPGVVAYQSALGADEVCQIDGVNATTPVRTATDLLRWAPSFIGLASLDAFAHAGLVHPDQVVDALARLSGQRGVARARDLVGLCEPATESAGESWMRLRVVQAGLPRPRVQIPIVVGGRVVYRLDAGYDEVRVGFEFDGEQFHSGPAAQAGDERRRDDLRARFGWTVVGVGREHVLGARPAVERVVADLIGWERPLARRTW